MKSVSDKRIELNKEYSKVRLEYLKEHPICEFPNCTKKATDIHHSRGRTGGLLTDKRYFKALDREHHRWVEEHPKEAKEIGLSLDRL